VICFYLMILCILPPDGHERLCGKLCSSFPSPSPSVPCAAKYRPAKGFDHVGEFWQHRKKPEDPRRPRGCWRKRTNNSPLLLPSFFSSLGTGPCWDSSSSDRFDAMMRKDSRRGGSPGSLCNASLSSPSPSPFMTAVARSLADRSKMVSSSYQ